MFFVANAILVYANGVDIVVVSVVESDVVSNAVLFVGSVVVGRFVIVVAVANAPVVVSSVVKFMF